jgi:hypothetical protein
MKTVNDMVTGPNSSLEKTNGPCLPAEGVTTKLLKEMMQPLSVPKPTRLVVIGCGVKVHFPWERACRVFESAVRETMETLDADQSRWSQPQRRWKIRMS